MEGNAKFQVEVIESEVIFSQKSLQTLEGLTKAAQVNNCWLKCAHGPGTYSGIASQMVERQWFEELGMLPELQFPHARKENNITA